MILDFAGRPLKRTAGFIRDYVPARPALPLVDALYVVGIEVPPVEEDEDEGDAARTQQRMRRTG